MIWRFHRSFAAKLIVGGCVLALVVVGGVAAYLIYSRASQTTSAALSNADNRVAVMSQVLDRFTGAQELSAATNLATQPSLGVALTSADPRAAVTALFSGGASPDLAGEVAVITDATGRIVYNRVSPDVHGAAVLAPPAAVRMALAGDTCTVETVPAAGSCGVELLTTSTDPVYVVAVPVRAAGTTVGAVAYLTPLSIQLDRFQALFGFPTAFVSARDPASEVRPTLGQTGSTDATLRSALAGGSTTHHSVYEAPATGGGRTTVAGSFLPVNGPDHAVAGFIGVEVPLSQFAGDERGDVGALALIAVFVLLLVVIVVVLFVERFVKRPIARLERGVARIAGGDYATDIALRSDDELGRLAGNVNRMRVAIAGYVRQVEDARQRQDAALERVSGVSRALTTTTTGLPSLQDAVVRTASLIGGESASAVLALRSGATLTTAAAAGDPPPLDDFAGVADVLGGETVRLEHPDHGALVAVPMFYQEDVVGALIVVRGAQAGASTEVDVDVLGVLANNAAIAMENARLFEQERQTVQRLLQLDSLKTDFLATVQHELRTPLTAILGLAELLETYWARWGEEPKLDAVRDIQTAANNLHDIVETIIDYSSLEDSDLRLDPVAVPVRAAVDESLEQLRERYTAGLPVAVEISGDGSLAVMADADRFSKVLRALLDNAVKFSDGRGHVAVNVAEADAGSTVTITVADQGIGIAEEDVPQVFDRFFQVDNTATRKYGGTGMGLAMVRRVVEAHGAAIAVESRVGEGTRVVLTWLAGPVGSAGSPGESSVERVTGSVSEPALPVQ